MINPNTKEYSSNTSSLYANCHLFNQPKNIETRHLFASAQAHKQGRLKSKETLDFQTALNESITQRLQQQQL